MKNQATCQQHDILMLLIENHPKKTSVIEIINRTYALNHTARISNLRRKGVEISCESVSMPNKYGGNSRHTFYTLLDIESAIKAEKLFAKSK